MADVSGTYKQIFQTTAVSDKVELFEDSETAVIFFLSEYLWMDQTLRFIDTVEIIKPTDSNKLQTHRMLHTKQRFFFEAHATDPKSLHSKALHFLSYTGYESPLPDLIKPGKLHDFSFDSATRSIVIVASDSDGLLKVYEQPYCGLQSFIKDGKCMPIPNSSVINFTRTYALGTLATDSCLSVAYQDWQMVQMAQFCAPQKLLPGENVFSLVAKHFELEGAECKMDEYVVVEEGTGVACKKCGEHCERCSMDGSCISCLSGTSLFSGTCKCPPLTIFSPTLQACTACPTNCLSCSYSESLVCL